MTTERQRMTETERINELRSNPAKLYPALVEIVGKMLPARYSEDEAHGIAHDSAVRLMDRIRRRGDEYRIGNIRQVLYREIQYHSLDYEGRRQRRKEAPFSVDIPDNRVSNSIYDEALAFDEVLGQPDGKRVILEIYFARSFRLLCNRLDTFKTRRWIYDNARQLKAVYAYTRAIKCRERKKGRQDKSPGISPLIPLLTRRSRST